MASQPANPILPADEVPAITEAKSRHAEPAAISEIGNQANGIILNAYPSSSGADSTSANEKTPLPVEESASPTTVLSPPIPTASTTSFSSPDATTDTTVVAHRRAAEPASIPTAAVDEGAEEEIAAPAATTTPAARNSISITLLMISGVRHIFSIDGAFLARNNIAVPAGDPMQLGVYQLKECIWKEWREAEWEQRPASANFIRLIHFGRLLEDRMQLKDCRLNPDTPNVVHMTVRPAEVDGDDLTQRSTKMGFGRDGAHREGSSPSCRCVIL